MRPSLNQDLLAGLFLTAIGVIFAIASLRLHLGTPTNMGPGFFPFAVSLLLTVLGIFAMLPALKGGKPLERPPVRQVVVVSVALTVFALLVQPFGLLPAVAAVVMISALADRSSSLVQTMLLALGACVVVWVIFLFGLELTIPAFRTPW